MWSPKPFPFLLSLSVPFWQMECLHCVPPFLYIASYVPMKWYCLCAHRKRDYMNRIFSKLLQYQHTLGVKAKPGYQVKWLSPFIQYTQGQTRDRYCVQLRTRSYKALKNWNTCSKEPLRWFEGWSTQHMRRDEGN